MQFCEAWRYPDGFLFKHSGFPIARKEIVYEGGHVATLCNRCAAAAMDKLTAPHDGAQYKYEARELVPRAAWWVILGVVVGACVFGLVQDGLVWFGGY